MKEVISTSPSIWEEGQKDEEMDHALSGDSRPIVSSPRMSPLSIDLWKLAPPSPPLAQTTVDTESHSSPASSFVRGSPVRKATRVQRGQVMLPSWELRSDCSKEIIRIYAMTYIPSSFWTRLITRLLTDSSLNAICRCVAHINAYSFEYPGF